MDGKDDLITRLNQAYSAMSKGQRLLYRYVLDHYTEVSHMTAEALGREVGVSEATVVRFAVFLGYGGYPQFRQAAGRYAQRAMNPVERLQNQYSGRSPEQVLRDVLRSDANQIRSVHESMDPQAFADTAELILSAQRIFIIGRDGMGALAEYLAYGLQMVCRDVILFDNAAGPGAMLPVLHIGTEDVLLVIGSEGRQEDLIRLLLFAHARGAGIATFFTNERIRSYADRDCTGHAEWFDDGAQGRLTVCFSILHALLTAIYLQKPDVIRAGTEAFEALQSGDGEKI